MERKEVNGRIYYLSHRILDGRALELTMRSLREVEKNIWRLDFAFLREEIKASYFYAPELSAELMGSMQGAGIISDRFRCQLLLGLVIRNPHWSVAEEEFFKLYGALQIDPDQLFSDHALLHDLHRFQHWGEAIEDHDLAAGLEAVKGLETKRILAFYQPASWKELNPGKQAVLVEKSRIRRIQMMMADESCMGMPWLEAALEALDEDAASQGNRWRIAMDQLQRRERTGVTNADIRKGKLGETMNHRMLGPVQVVDIQQEAGLETWVLKGLLRTYYFRYEKKR